MTAFVGPNGQGKTNLVEAVGYLATLGSHRVAQDAPLVRLGAERAVVRGQVVRDDRALLVELEITPGRANRARVNRSPVAAAARGARHPAQRAVRARGPGAGQGRPGRAPPVPRRAARAARTPLRRRARRLRPGAPQRNALLKSAGGAARPGRRRSTCARSTSGTPTSRPPAPSCSPAASSWSTACSPLVDTAYEAVADDTAAAGVTTAGRRRSPTAAASSGDGRRRPATAAPLAEWLLRRAARTYVARSSTAASPWSGRTATTWS